MNFYKYAFKQLTIIGNGIILVYYLFAIHAPAAMKMFIGREKAFIDTQ